MPNGGDGTGKRTAKLDTGGSKPTVRATWYEKNKTWEGDAAHMYLDTKGLVTIGVGNMIDAPNDPVRGWRNAQEQLAGLTFQKADGGPVSTAEIQKEWQTLRDHPEWSNNSTEFFRKRSTIQLTEESKRRLVMNMFDRHEVELKALFPDYGTWPAEAQFAVHSMMWALGPKGYRTKFPKMIAALKKRDFVTAAKESAITPINDKVKERSDHNASLLNQAAIVDNPPPGLDILPSGTLPTPSMMDQTKASVLQVLLDHEEAEEAHDATLFPNINQRPTARKNSASPQWCNRQGSGRKESPVRNRAIASASGGKSSIRSRSNASLRRERLVRLHP